MIMSIWSFIASLFGFEEKPSPNAGYGWRADKPDHRDHLYEMPVGAGGALPASTDLEPHCPPVYDQGQLGSCTANAIGGAYEFDLRKQGKTDFMPSRLFIYYHERAIEGTIKSDSGAEIRDGIKTIADKGVCTEKTWPYVISRFAKAPSSAAYAEATHHTAVSYQRLDGTNLTQLKTCLASGYPIVFGFTVYEAFESQEVAQTGVLNMPQPGEQMMGGHAVLIVGYDDATQRFKVRNSWGTGWGLNGSGYFTVPYAYVTNANLADDFWTVRTVKG
jgi:C1A family cysteine protease